MDGRELNGFLSFVNWKTDNTVHLHLLLTKGPKKPKKKEVFDTEAE